ncbi:MAG: arginine N-succinyltransferase [Kiritimatiellae bacterium]|nr:arginine N-succinyltransferase [Kiritimatiellia bacterium]
MNGRASAGRRFGCLHVLLFVSAAVILTAVVGFFVARVVLFPRPFKPVKLNEREEQVLDAKLDRLDFAGGAATGKPVAPAAKPAAPPTPAKMEAETLEPEPYSEEGASRTIRFTEKELNALLAKNTDLANKLAIDLSQDLVSARLLVPLDEDFPVMGGKTVRVKTGMMLSYTDGRPVVMLRGVSVMGVPLPNAWLGGMKNIDLVKESGGNEGFWKAFADGVQDVRVEEGCIAITLKE